MKSILFLTATLMSLSLSAHIEPGTWKGTISPEADCFFEVGAQTFENNMQHPLNERIQITIGSTSYSIRHPYQINPIDGSVTYNHDLFEAVTPTANGAYALQIHMEHSESYEGPTSLSVMEHNWKTGFKEVLNCSNLKKVN
jgi:hypothetical protein